MPRLVNDEEISQRLSSLDGWSGDTRMLRRTVEAADFVTAIRIVDEIAVAAEEMNHHPDVDIRWRTLHLGLTTHSEGGVTENDFALAGAIDAIVRRHQLA